MMIKSKSPKRECSKFCVTGFWFPQATTDGSGTPRMVPLILLVGCDRHGQYIADENPAITPERREYIGKTRIRRNSLDLPEVGLPVKVSQI